jgi:hypothetical protein
MLKKSNGRLRHKNAQHEWDVSFHRVELEETSKPAPQVLSLKQPT